MCPIFSPLDSGGVRGGREGQKKFCESKEKLAFSCTKWSKPMTF